MLGNKSLTRVYKLTKYSDVPTYDEVRRSIDNYAI